jgi:CRP-like cAMP-binding protein
MAKFQASPHSSGNLILRNLSPADFDRLSRWLQPVEFELRQVIYEPNAPIRYAYFPEDGMISVVSSMGNGSSIEVGTIGREAMAGAVLLLDTDRVPYQYFVQLPGHGQRIDAAALKQEVEQNESLRKAILRSESAFLIQTMQLVACNGLHEILPRCCRWLLMARDRCDSDDLYLTHEFLALMLGVRRASVSDVLRPIQEAGLVHSNHGKITILDRKGLEAGACECYRIIADQQQRLLANRSQSVQSGRIAGETNV